ncbi:MAG TPA: hypothetical protein VGC96_12680 [Candidatus Elarobacter sp.]|jgi:hypothetical protein
MYQLATECRPERSALFMESCTSMNPTVETMRLVRSATSLVRSVLEGGDIAPLRDLLARAEAWCDDVDDVLAVAGQTVIDELETLPRAGLHDVVRRVAQVERDALLADRSIAFRTAYAG